MRTSSHEASLRQEQSSIREVRRALASSSRRKQGDHHLSAQVSMADEVLTQTRSWSCVAAVAPALDPPRHTCFSSSYHHPTLDSFTMDAEQQQQSQNEGARRASEGAQGRPQPPRGILKRPSHDGRPAESDPPCVRFSLSSIKLESLMTRLRRQEAGMGRSQHR